jgi:hypothetical protein
MTNEQHLNQLLTHIAALTGECTSKDQAKEKGYERYLQLENAPSYGGWRLVNVGVNNGAHYGAFSGNGCEPRLKYKVMVVKLEGIIAGLECLNTLMLPQTHIEKSSPIHIPI